MKSPLNGRKWKLCIVWAAFALLAWVFVLAHFMPHGEHAEGNNHNCAICHAWSLQSVPASPAPDLPPEMPVARLCKVYRRDVPDVPNQDPSHSRAPPQFSFL